MKENTRRYPLYQRLLSFGLAALMVFGIVPLNTKAETAAKDYTENHVTTVADPQTIGSLDSVYGSNTKNAGKVTVDKSVYDGAVTLTYGSNSQTFTPAENNFIVTSSQTAQIMGLASESTAPVDVVFVLDTSYSMDGRVTEMVDAANAAIRTLLKANENNRVAVVAFSGTSGRGTSNGAAANVLTPLDHYNGDGETAHLTYTDNMIYGRGTTGNNRWSRLATSSGTNIHAGVVVGAQQLMNAQKTTIQIDGESVTRIPFLVIMSDGQPSYAASGTDWYNPTLTSQIGDLSNVAGLGFLPALTAAYYKGAITDKYFGTNSSASNRCFVYTMGLGLTSLSSNLQDLALMTVDPSNATSSNNYYKTFENYWNNYVKGTDFTISVASSGRDENYTITEKTIDYTKNYVNGKRTDGTSMGYTGGYQYNDKYFSATQASDLSNAFDGIVVSIQQQAMSSPTHVDAAYGEDFSGYVTYTDHIGEYMEVKNIFGVLADGNYYQGKSFAQNIQAWNSGATQEFKDSFLKVLKERCKVTGASLTDAELQTIIEKAIASGNQAYYKSDDDYDNSLVWWGKSYTAEGEEDVQIQILDFAEDDSIEYITDPNTEIPAGADYVCRSYYFYGEAGGTAANPNHEYLHFVVRVQRSLKAPYQETVVISAPASLLSVEEVMITEIKDASGNVTYTAQVEEAEPAHVVYEVGLRSDINAFNVDQILEQDAKAAVDAYDYVGENSTSTAANANYDPATGTYHFYTNDWDRTESASQRAMTHVTFDAAADNAFYTYIKDTPIYTKNGDTYTLYNGSSKPVGNYYYAREVYDWSASTATGSTHTAVKKTEYILVDIPADSSAVKQGTDSWYIAQGAYKASSLSSDVEDLPKEPNNTGTSTIVVHPQRTESETNSHYTVLLGNNGKLSLKSADTKSVMINAEAGATIRNDDGKVVMVGDVLTYTIKVVNGESTAAGATVTDSIPTGTVYVENSATEGGTYDAANKVITWNIEDIPAGKYVDVSFQVMVTEAALTGDLDVVAIENAASVTLENDFSYTTNTTTNPPEGKKAVDTNGNAITGNVDVPDVLVYRIRWHNDSNAVSTVTVNDIIPAGTTYVENSASHNGVYDAATKTITWTMANVQPGTSGVVSFRVNVNATAGTVIENDANIQVGSNDPRVTNKTTVNVAKGDLVLSKTVETNGYDAAAGQTFTLNITEIGLGLNGKFRVTSERNATTTGSAAGMGSSPSQGIGEIEFKNGIATLTIFDGETVTIHGITAGAIISVTEEPKAGFTAQYTTAAGTSSAEGRVTIEANADVSVAVKNTYKPEEVSFHIQAVKKMDAKMPLGNTVFSFIAERYVAEGNGFALATGENAQVISGEVTVSSTSAADGVNIAFSPISAKEAGTYYYLIKEINNGLTGIHYANTQYWLEVTIVDDGSGKLQVGTTTLSSREGDSGAFTPVAGTTVAEFKNTYEPAATQLPLTGFKNMTGRPIQDREFSFTVKDEQGNTVTTGYNTDTDADADQLFNNVVFAPITYLAADMAGAAEKTFVYYVTEDHSGAYGVAYSEDQYKLTVKVTNNGGQLSASIQSVEKWDAQSQQYAAAAEGKLQFTNIFTPDDVALNLEGTKTLLDPDGNKLELADQQFAFVVEEMDSNGVWQVVTVGNNTTEQTAANSGIYKIRFSTIYYDLEDLDGATSKTFVYRVSEVVPVGPSSNPNMHYSRATYLVDVVLTQNADGSLAVSHSIQNASAIAFTNILRPDHVDVPVVGSKITEDSNGNPVNGPSFSFSVMNEANTQAVTGGTAAANGPINFTKLTYTQPGTHYYWIYESNHAGQTAHGIDYSAQRFLLKVVVTRDETTREWDYTTTYYEAGTVNDSAVVANYNNGTEVSGANVVFKNVYGAKGFYDITATKTLTGSLALGEQDYLFKLERLDDNGGVISTMYVANTDSDGDNAYDDVVFPSIIFADNELVDHDQNSETPRTVTYRYRMSEMVTDENRLPGVEYSETVYYFTITATDDGSGGITTTVTCYTDSTFQTTANVTEFTFANEYKPATGTSAEIVATKVLNGRDLREGEFRFELFYVETKADGSKVEHLVDTAYNMDTDNDGVYNDVYFVRTYPATTAPGSYNYVIKEVSGNQGTIGYDTTTVGSATVVIGEDTQNATLTSTVSYPNGAITFTNGYTPKGTTLSLEGTKILQNRDAADGEFSFDVLRDGNSVATGYNTDLDGDGKYDEIKFTDFNYTPAHMWDNDTRQYLTTKEFTYTVVEIKGNAIGVAYSQEEYRLKVTVTTDADGQMSAAITGWEKRPDQNSSFTAINANEALVFTNTYTPEDVFVQLQANKVIQGHNMEEGEFTFLVYDVTNGQTPVLKSTGGNAAAADGQTVPITFSNIIFTHAMLGGESSKEFIYSIAEQPSTHGGVQRDETVYYAKVTLTHNSDGTLSTAVAYYKDAACSTSIDGTVPVFVNKYVPAAAEVTLYADKTLINKDLAAEEFIFTLLGENVNDSKENNAAGRVTFDKLTFTTPGVYTYTITESVADRSKAHLYTLDNAFKVVVTVVDDQVGHLVATVTYHEIKADGTYDASVNLGGAEFINHYTAPALTKDLSGEIGATKTVETPAGVSHSLAGFKFAVTDTTGTIVNGYDAQGNAVNIIGVSDAEGKISFPSFCFPSAGEYHYWITEQPSGMNGVADDPRTWEVHILVRYNDQTGLLYVNPGDIHTYLVGRTVSSSAKPVFVNIYDPTPIKLTLTATKILEGRELKDREFLFYLMEGDRIVAQGHNDVNGTVEFDLTYTAADIGSHSYQIKELIPEKGLGGVSYDSKTHTAVTVTVTHDEATYKLVASVGGNAVADGAVQSTGVTITNKYQVSGTAVEIHAEKVLTGGKMLKGDDYTFTLTNKADEKEVYTAKNNANGQIVFKLPAYTKAGVYTYTMAEVKGTDSSITYDETVHTVTVTVTDDLHGQLHAVVAYEKNVVPTFTNHYKAASTTAEVKANKTLLGDMTLAADKYVFELVRADGVIVTTKNQANGDVVFNLKFDAVGVYVYELREKSGDEPGTTYDDSVYKVTVTVEDDLNGSLKATVKYDGLEAGKVPSFVNSYKGKEAPVKVTATKKLEGKTLKADAFAFTLTNKDNTKEVYTVKNDAEGNVVFNLNLANAGTYTYILAEAAGTDANITYDKTTYTVTIKVTDDLKGQMQAEVTYSTTDNAAPVFKNVHTPSPITVELAGTKTLNGRKMAKGEFSFEVRDSEGNVVATAKNTADGKLAFSGIELKEAGKYVYTVTEVKGKVKGMIYDTATFTVTVNVENQDGVLKAEITYPEGGVAFENTYKEPDSTNPGTGDDTPLLLLVGLMVVSGGAVVFLLATRKKRSQR